MNTTPIPPMTAHKQAQIVQDLPPNQTRQQAIVVSCDSNFETGVLRHSDPKDKPLAND